MKLENGNKCEYPDIFVTDCNFTHPLSGFLLLLKLPDVLLHHVGPEVALKVGKLRWRLDVVLEGLLVDVFVVQHDPLYDALVQHLLVPLLQEIIRER